MNQLPADLSPEIATWLRLQATLAASRLVQPVEAETRECGGFATGLLIVMAQLMPMLLESHPDMGERLASDWKQAADRYDAICAGSQRDDGEPAEQLEARALIYRACEERGLWSSRGASATASCAPLRRRVRH